MLCHGRSIRRHPPVYHLPVDTCTVRADKRLSAAARFNTVSKIPRSTGLMEKAVFLISIPLSIGGCITDTGGQLPDARPASADSISSVAIQGRTVSFVVSCAVPTLCFEFVRSDYSISGQSIPVTVYVRSRNNYPCPEVISSLEAPATIVVPSSGSYTFRFWRYEGQTLDTTLTFQ